MFDGPEDRNGWRNFDEIRLLRLLLGSKTKIRNDSGHDFAAPSSDPFIILGDLNVDPTRGDSQKGAVQQLLEHERVHVEGSLGTRVPRRTTGKKLMTNTSTFGLRVDYVLPSKDFRINASGVCEGPLLTVLSA